MNGLSSSSPASFAAYDGGSAISSDSAGNIDVYAPTSMSFQLQSADGSQYVPVGISFDQVGSGPSDPGGKRNFPSFSISGGTLTVTASDLDAVGFEYSIVYKRLSDGAKGLVYPKIINHKTA